MEEVVVEVGTNRRQMMPPPKFVPADNVVRAEFGVPPQYLLNTIANAGTRSRSSQDGLKYEAKVVKMLTALYPELVSGAWMKFAAGTFPYVRERWCQADAFLADHTLKRVYVFEIKLSHIANSWWQLQRLYIPVLRHIFIGYDFVPIEICKWYDPHTAFPVFFKPEPNIRELSKLSPNVFYVHIWSGTKADIKVVQEAAE